MTRVRSFPAAEHGVPAPAAVVWSDRLGALVVAGDAKPGTRLAVVTPAERDLGGATVPAAQAASLSVDPRDGRILLVAGGRLHSFAGEGVVTGKPEDRVGGPVPLTDIRGATPTASGELLVLAGGNLVRLDNGRIVSSQPVQVPSGHDLRGLARDPQTGRLHTFDATAHQVLALDEDGAPVRVYDTTGLDVTDVRGLAFGPSADATDEPATQSLYLADAAGAVVEAAVDTTAVTALANVQPTSSRVVATSSYNPPSPDPSGIGYLPDQDRLLIDDGEVEEMTIYQGANFFVTNRAGSLADTGTTLPWSKEPTGVGYNAANKHLFVSDDSQLEVFEDAPGGDGRYGTGDDVVTHFDTAVFGSNDPEGVEYEAPSNSVWIADGVNREVYRVRAGSDGRFGTTDDMRSHFDTAQYGTGDPEGMAYDSVRDTMLVLDDASQRIYELDKTGALLNTIDVTSVGMVNAAGLTVAPSSTGSGRSYYAVARGIDNDNHPTENDGRLYEITASLPATGGGGVNQAPSVNAGADQTVVLPSTAALDGTVDDDGLPNPPGATTTTWTKASGPGTVTFANASAPWTPPPPSPTPAPTCCASPPTTAEHLRRGHRPRPDLDLRLRRDRPERRRPDRSRLRRRGAGRERRDRPDQHATSSWSPTARPSRWSASGSPGSPVPAGATITNAYVQFQTDEVSTDAASLTIRAEAADNAATYQAANKQRHPAPHHRRQRRVDPAGLEHRRRGRRPRSGPRTSAPSSRRSSPGPAGPRATRWPCSSPAPAAAPPRPSSPAPPPHPGCTSSITTGSRRPGEPGPDGQRRAPTGGGAARVGDPGRHRHRRRPAQPTRCGHHHLVPGQRTRHRHLRQRLRGGHHRDVLAGRHLRAAPHGVRRVADHAPTRSPSP